MSRDLAAEVAALERELAERRAVIAAMRAKVDVARERQATMEDLWGAHDAGVTLPIGPLLAALVGIVCANAAAFCGYVVFLSRWSSGFFSLGCLAAAVVSELMLAFSARFGAGGRARVGIRRMTMALLAATALELLAASVFPR